MFEAIVSGLLISSLGALSFLAYNHPTEYRAFSNFVIGGLVATGLVVLSCMVALLTAEAEILAKLADAGLSDAEKIVRNTLKGVVPRALLLWSGLAIIAVYVLGLRWWVTKLKPARL